MKIWLVKRTDKIDYDEYDSFVVAHETEDAARNSRPSEFDGWPVNPSELHVVEIGDCTYPWTPGTVFCASFNAG